MDEYIYYSELYDLYKELLTSRQRDYFEDYYFKNLSFSEISDNYNVSRNAVYNLVKITKDLLVEYENKLNLKSKFDKIESLLTDSEIDNKIKEILNS